MVWPSDRRLSEMGGLADCMEKTTAGEHSWTGVSISVPGRAKEAGCRCLSYNFAGKESVYRGTDRCGQNNFHNLSGGKSSGRRAGRPDLLSHGKDHHSNCGKRNVRTAGRTGLSCQSDPDYSKRKTLPVWRDGLQPGKLSICKGTFWPGERCGVWSLAEIQPVYQRRSFSAGERISGVPVWDESGCGNLGGQYCLWLQLRIRSECISETLFSGGDKGRLSVPGGWGT